MNSGIVNLVGGYGSDGFWLLAFGLLAGGAILNAVHSLIFKVIGCGLFIFGGILLMGFITFTVDANPYLPSYASYYPMLFEIILLLTVFKMLAFDSTAKKDSTPPDKSTNEAK